MSKIHDGIKLYTWVLCMAMLSSLTSNAQKRPRFTHNGLAPGSSVSLMTLGNVLNYPDSIIDLNQYKGKLIILDFWNHACLACIEAFPKMDKLQKQFEGKIQIIAVNHESKDSTERFFKKFHRIKKPAVPFITGDTTLYALFPHHGDPYHVWIDENGVVLHKTIGSNTNDVSIAKHLNGQKLDMIEVKNVAIEKYSQNDFVAEAFRSNVAYYSYLGHLKTNVFTFGGFGYTREGLKHYNKFTSNAGHILNLFQVAFEENGKFNFQAGNSLLLNGIDTLRFFKPRHDSLVDHWIRNNNYTYSVGVPEERAEELFSFMQADVQRYFNVDAKVVYQKRKVLVLKRMKNTPFKFETKISDTVDLDKYKIYRKVAMKDLATMVQKLLNKEDIPYVVLDRTGYAEPATFKVLRSSLNPISVEKLKAVLNDVGIELRWQTIRVPVLKINQL